MRKIELRVIEGINVVYADGEHTSIQYTKNDINFMLDDLATSFPSRSRNDLLTDLIQRTAAKSNLEGGPLTGDELPLKYPPSGIRVSA